MTVGFSGAFGVAGRPVAARASEPGRGDGAGQIAAVATRRPATSAAVDP